MLSRRERSVLTLIGTGKTSKDIALILQLSPSTVASYRKCICRKLCVHSTAELIAYAVRMQLPEASSFTIALHATPSGGVLH